MTPGASRLRPLALVAAGVALLAAVSLGAWAWWNDPAAATRSDDDYIAIARSAPEVFRSPATGPLRATVDRSGRLAVDFWQGDRRVMRVLVHPRTERVEGVMAY